MFRTDMAVGMVVVLGASVTPSLRTVAKRWLLTILANGSATSALHHMLGIRPRVVVVQVGPNNDEPLRFIRSAAGAGDRSVIIAAATHHTAELERMALRAGARFYVHGVSNKALAPFLEAALEPRGRSERHARDTSDA
ncbi:MAG: hypothetical protein ACE5E5_02605 [Phycisphaerae bacterium]